MQVATHNELGTVQIVSINGGWTTITHNDTTVKVRNKSLTDHREEEIDAPKVEVVPGRKNGVVDPGYLPQYEVNKVVRAGRTIRVVDSGDALAVAFRTKTLDEVYAVAAKRLDQTVESLKEKFAHLNVGMQRMSVGNMMRRLDREEAAK